MAEDNSDQNIAQPQDGTQQTAPQTPSENVADEADFRYRTDCSAERGRAAHHRPSYRGRGGWHGRQYR